MQVLSEMLPIIIYILLIGLIIISIIIGVKLIMALNKIDKIINDVDEKVSSLDGLFKAINSTTNKITGIYQTAYGFVSNITNKLFIRKNKRKEDENYE